MNVTDIISTVVTNYYHSTVRNFRSETITIRSLMSLNTALSRNVATACHAPGKSKVRFCMIRNGGRRDL